MNLDQADREVASRTDEVMAIAATLMELDSHPAREHMRNFPPQGVTAQRWAIVEPTLGQLWEDLNRMMSILESARATRDLTELTRLLHGQPLEVSRERVPLMQRTITDPGEIVDHIGLAGLADRMRSGYPAVAEFLDAVDRIDTLVAGQLAVAQKQLDKSGVPAPPEFAELLTVSATDPLSLTTAEIGQRALVISGAIELLADWPAAMAETAGQLDALRTATLRAGQARELAERAVVTGALPTRPDPVPVLREAFTGITAGDTAELRAVRKRIEAALEQARADEALAAGLLDRRSELKGRLTAYQAKAARLGLGEDLDLMASGRIASGLLSRRPCDLGAVTRAVVTFQQLLADKLRQQS